MWLPWSASAVEDGPLGLDLVICEGPDMRAGSWTSICVAPFTTLRSLNHRATPPGLALQNERFYLPFWRRCSVFEVHQHSCVWPLSLLEDWSYRGLQIPIMLNELYEKSNSNVKGYVKNVRFKTVSVGQGDGSPGKGSCWLDPWDPHGRRTILHILTFLTLECNLKSDQWYIGFITVYVCVHDMYVCIQACTCHNACVEVR